jgi:carboxynorspermidine decarboxylase
VLPRIGDILTFGDMAIYSMVKNNTFNGMALPDIVLERDADAEDRFELVKRFGYEDFKGRLS